MLSSLLRRCSSAGLICLGLLAVWPIKAQEPDAGPVAATTLPAARSPVPMASEDELPYQQPPISYSQTTPRDPVANLRARLEQKEIILQKEGPSGVLKQLLHELHIPVSSQLLVFSKSSAQAKLIKPATPRALYFNDDVYVGWVPGSSLIEISAADPELGGTFYSLRQPNSGEIQFRRDASCLLCHQTRNTLRVPGHLVRSFSTDALGQMQSGWSRTTHETSFEKRWAGWYVTGETDSLGHPGNVYGASAAREGTAPAPFDISKSCDLTDYLTSTSDVLPHLILDHQAHGHNLITRLSYEFRLQKPITALEPLVRYLLFLDEAPLPTAVAGNAEYRGWFAQQGARDSQGRSLREFDLQTRIFKYRLSYLVNSPAFAALPDEPRLEVWKQIKEFLMQPDQEGQATVIPAAERQAILEIARATVTGLPEGW
jgi:hypothetical protein